jgi:predicted nucleotidyltransferase
MTPDVEKVKNSLFVIAPDVLGRYPVLFAYLYGSYATGIIHPFSDLDIALFTEGLPERDHLKFELSLSLEIDTMMGGRVASEVRVVNTLPLIVTGKIITEGLLIYSRNEVARVDFETSVRSAYFDFLPVIHRYQRIYADSTL